MATTLDATTLTYRVSETITLGGVNYDSIQENTITGIGNFVNNTFRIGAGLQAIIKFNTTQRDADYVSTDVRYFRMTNLDDATPLVVEFIYSKGSKEAVFISPLASFVAERDTFVISGDTLVGIEVTAAADVDVQYVIGLAQ